MAAKKKTSPIQFERRSLELTPAQWAAIEHLAAKAGAIAATGPHAGQPSWRTWIKDLADAENARQAQPSPAAEAAPAAPANDARYANAVRRALQADRNPRGRKP